MDNIIKKTNSPGPNETLVSVSRAGSGWKAEWAKKSILPSLIAKRYAVRYLFEPPKIISCSPITVVNPEDGEKLEIQPKLRIERVPEENILKVAETFHPFYEQQDGYLRRETESILHRYIDEASDPVAEVLEPVHNRSWNYRVAQELRARTGLEVFVQLLNDDDVNSWIAALKAEPSRYLELEFRPLSTPRSYKLRMSFRVTGIAIRNWNILCARSRANRNPSDELAAIETRIGQILDPVVTTMQAAVIMSNHGGFWRHVEHMFSEGVGLRIAEEFGCQIAISDLKRDKTDFETQLDKKEDPEAVDRVTKMMSLIDEARENHAELLRATGFNLEDEAVQTAERSVKALEGRLGELKEQLNKEKQLTPVRYLPGIESLSDLRTAAEQARRTLHLPPPTQDDETWLLDEAPKEDQPDE